MTQSHQGQGETVVSVASRPLSIPTLLSCCRVLVVGTGNYRSSWWCQHWVCLRLLALKTPEWALSSPSSHEGWVPLACTVTVLIRLVGVPLSSNLPCPPLPSQHPVSTQPQGTFPQAC